MTLSEAKKELDFYFEFNDELISYSHELTDNGVLTKAHLSQLSDDELIDVADDARYDIKCSLDGLI